MSNKDYVKNVIFALFLFKFSLLMKNYGILDQNLLQKISTIYGIGRRSCLRVCDDLGLCPNSRYKDCTSIIKDRIDFYIQENYFTGNNLKFIVKKDIAKYCEISCYRGIRHSRKLPCRGQRTHGNAKTVRRKLL